MLTLLFALTGFAAVYVLWQYQQRARVRATAYVRQQCQQQGLQLLDDTLMLASMGLQRRPLRVRRRYDFEFSSTGDSRYQGHVVLCGLRISALYLDAHRVS